MPASRRPYTLRRSLGLGLLVFYGLGVIIGAGVYVAVGDVIEAAGSLAVLSFAVAGALATLTALSYAELGARYPEAAGAAAYVQEAFRSAYFSRVTGFVVALVVLISAATIARGTAGYAKTFIAFPDAAIAGGFVIVFTAVSCLGVKDSARVAAAMTMVELAGLLLVIGAGTGSLGNLKDHQTELFASDLTGWLKVLSGAFLAFFAFTGFENLANMAEEAKNAVRTLPLAILISLGLSTALYVTVAVVVVAAVPIEQAVSSPAPLLLVIGPDTQASSRIFSGLALVAVSNGVLIQVLVLSRLFYGMARRRLLPGWLAALSTQQVPVRATILAGGLILTSTLLLPFHALLHLSTTLTLLLFVQVNLSLCRLHLEDPRPELGFRVPRPIPYMAALASIGLIVAQFLG